MTGLEKILEQIRLDAEESAAGIRKQAEQEAAEFLNGEEAGIEKQLLADREKIKSDAALKLSRGQSAAALYRRKKLLYARQEIVADRIEEAKQYLKDLPDEEYFLYLKRLLTKYALQEKGEICFSRRDLKRLPQDFRSYAESMGLAVSNQPVRTDGGFLLSYRDAVVDCSFDVLFASERDRLADKVKEMLF
ncbi:MAG: V-type ATP synthase subunit E [Lachnospiraceae bacterium]|nr:V-type ATP synthase subunit E [Lachnospiraceae bacterium]